MNIGHQTRLAHRGTPGLVLAKNPEEVPVSWSDVRRLKKKHTLKIKEKNRERQEDIRHKMKQLKAQRKKSHMFMKVDIRQKHKEVDKAYRRYKIEQHAGPGWYAGTLRKALDWRKRAGRPIGSTTSRPALMIPQDYQYQDAGIVVPQLMSPRQTSQEPGISPYTDQEGELIIPHQGHRLINPNFARTSTPAQKMLPSPIPVITDPRHMLPPSGGTIGTRISTPVTRPEGPDFSTMRQVGPARPLPQIGQGSRPVNAIGSNIRGLLPAAGQTTTKLKMKNLVKKLSK